MQIDRNTIKLWLNDEIDVIAVSGGGEWFELSVSAIQNIAQRAAKQALQGLEIIATDQGVNVIKDGVLVAYQAHSAERSRELNVRALLSGEKRLASPACHCEACDEAANGGLRSRMSLCPQCGDKRCPRAEHHASVCQKATG